jgi:hypothetical protein
MKIVVERNSSYAPCSYIVCKVIDDHWNDHDENNTILVDTDWGWPSLASALGWSPCHDSTDGTIDCDVCGNTASQLITSAGEWIDNHLGEIVDDPGYFSE